MPGEDSYDGYKNGHHLIIKDREEIEVTGVLDIDHFEDQEIIVQTEKGLLAIRGEDLRVKNLNREQGKLDMEGYVYEFAYSDEETMRDRSRNFLSRIFR